MNKKYFGTDGIRGRVGDELIHPEFILKLGWAAGCVLARAGHTRVVIGKDTRISGYLLESALEAGFSAAGVDVILLGPMPTPAIAYLTRAFRASVGVAISASHNPFYDNGVKFFNSLGMKLSDEFELQIEEQLSKPLKVVDSAILGKATRSKDAAGRYIEFCKSTFPNHLSLEGMKIVIDAANGAAYHVAKNVFEELNAEVEAIGADPDGLNINLECGATDTRWLQKAVVVNKANIGIALDGDADRCIMVDHTGTVVDGDEILCILAHQAKIDDHKKINGVVGTLMSNLGLERALKNKAIDFVRAQVGDRYVMEALLERNWSLGGESSGHVVNLDLTTTGDGLITALSVLRAMRSSEKSLFELKKVMHKFPQTLINVAVPELGAIRLSDYPAIIDAIRETESALGNRGRLLVRPSGTEPLIRVMVEATDSNLSRTAAETLSQFIRKNL